MSQWKTQSIDWALHWLDETSANGTFYSSHYDPNFNIEEVRGLLDESKEEQDV